MQQSGGVGESDSQAWRHVVVLFTDLSDSTHLSDVMEAEVYAEMFDQFQQAFEESVALHGGKFNQVQGDGLQALFGYPLAGESDGQHAVEAALEIHARVRLLRQRYADLGAADLSVHSGIHAGPLLTRLGGSASSRVELFGPAPGLAKHLSDVAGPDQILVSDETLGPVRLFFHTHDREAVVLKGRHTPLIVHRVLGRNALRTRFEAHARRGLIPFIGRQEELSRLQRVLAEAKQGRSAFLALSAPPGMGKTRLAEEVLHRAAHAGWALWRGHCEDGLGAEPLQPFRRMLRQLIGLQAADDNHVAAAKLDEALTGLDLQPLTHWSSLRLLLSIPDVGDSSQSTVRAAPEALQAAICQLFAALARRRPQLVFIDDWQWSDETTRQVAAALRQLRSLPIVLLVTTRPLDRADAALIGADVIELRPFNELESRWSIARMLPEVDPFVVDTICMQSGGNPLYIEELCHAVATRATRATSDHEALETPGAAWLETLIASRVARLPPEQTELLQACAVIGNLVPLWQLQAVTPMAADDVRLTALAEQDLLFATEDAQALQFKHGITRDVVYAGIGLQRRRAMHLKLARLIKERAGEANQMEVCEALAQHFAGASQPAEAASYAAMAGDKALAASSLRRARTQYLAALEMLDRGPSSPETYQAWRAIVRRLGFVCVYDPVRSDLSILQTAAQRARSVDDVPGLAYAQYWLAYLHYALGDLRAAVRGFEDAASTAAAIDDPHLARQLRATRGQALSASGDYPGALELLGECRPVTSSRRPTAGGEAFSLACKASVLGDMGRFDESLACFDDAIAAVPHAGHEVRGSVLCWRSGVLLWQGRWHDALNDAQQAHQVAHGVKSLYLFAMSRAQMAYAQWRIGGQPAELADLADAAGWLVSRDKALFVSLVHGWLVEGLTTTGAVRDARAHAARALWRCRQCDWLGASMAARAMAQLAAGSGRGQDALRYLDKADRVAQVRRSAHEAASNEWCRAQVLLASGESGLARLSLEAALDGFQRLGMAWHREQAERLLPLLM